MELDTQTRGLIDTIIDNVVQNVGEIVKLYFNPESKKQLHIQNESDFVLGVAFGIISLYKELYHNPGLASTM
jgi:hypothetical protein